MMTYVLQLLDGGKFQRPDDGTWAFCDEQGAQVREATAIEAELLDLLQDALTPKPMPSFSFVLPLSDREAVRLRKP